MIIFHNHGHLVLTHLTWIIDCALIQLFMLLVKYYNMAMRFELATRRVTSPDSEIFTPFELQVNFTQKMLALPYQKYSYIFWKEIWWGIQIWLWNEVGWGTNILWLNILGFCGPQNQFFSESHISFPYYQIYFSSAYLDSSSDFLSENVEL